MEGAARDQDGGDPEPGPPAPPFPPKKIFGFRKGWERMSDLRLTGGRTDLIRRSVHQVKTVGGGRRKVCGWSSPRKPRRREPAEGSRREAPPGEWRWRAAEGQRPGGEEPSRAKGFDQPRLRDLRLPRSEAP